MAHQIIEMGSTHHVSLHRLTQSAEQVVMNQFAARGGLAFESENCA